MCAAVCICVCTYVYICVVALFVTHHLFSVRKRIKKSPKGRDTKSKGKEPRAHNIKIRRRVGFECCFIKVKEQMDCEKEKEGIFFLADICGLIQGIFRTPFK